MDNNEKESKNEADLTANQVAPTDETKTEENKVDTPEVPEEENVTLSKKELEDLKKRAADFDRSVELKRLKKLEERGEIKTETGDDVKDEIAKLRDELSTFKAQSYNSNLTEAYRQFVAENPWANDDAKFDKIKESFSTVGTETKDELYSKLKSAAISAYPSEWEKHLEDKIKAKAMSNKFSPDSGTAADAKTLHKDDDKIETEEDKMKKRLAEKLKSYLPSKR